MAGRELNHDSLGVNFTPVADIATGTMGPGDDAGLDATALARLPGCSPQNNPC